MKLLREAGPPIHLDDKVDSDQEFVKKELSLARDGEVLEIFPRKENTDVPRS